MNTKNKRFSITITDEEVSTFLESTSQEKNKSLSSVVMDLLKIAIEYDEDHYWSRVAEEAEQLAEGKPTIPAEVLWKELDLI